MTNEKLRSLCIKHNWFTAGSNNQYEKLFEMNRNGVNNYAKAIAIWLCSEDWELDDILNILDSNE